MRTMVEGVRIRRVKEGGLHSFSLGTTSNWNFKLETEGTLVMMIGVYTTNYGRPHKLAIIVTPNGIRDVDLKEFLKNTEKFL